MSLTVILFYVMAALTLVSALFVASTGNLVRSVFMFFVTLFGLAGLYVFALADFVAITQIVIYVGGILVLILFAFMLSNKETLGRLQEKGQAFIGFNNLPSAILALLFFGVLVSMIFKVMPDQLEWIANSVANGNTFKATDTTTNNLGINLMTRYLLPFEAVSILLMMVLVGAAHLSRKESGA
ncbi:NADH-quinone oxidoreductase subunit J family protein [Mucilaginibacter myungsuensis]|uniref:NADH-quinone oxidoreductase subunit J n=1 Tax=Mucilaginibacter myungsuensis TaxID=649104 RepID=A0A929L156_9SPHI|nr:NADH-quinone oxidoreductase subunit J [Mucilaginibacter myungsuensis]MBE9664228.1 NADH-quinone oxidoreductase subunit J [Mucilaginibacter myungsuensis]MDN3599932.1 NADH-quinone oxidoreductase subunit J [Mucilaginibacter myungsuensis]